MSIKTIKCQQINPASFCRVSLCFISLLFTINLPVLLEYDFNMVLTFVMRIINTCIKIGLRFEKDRSHVVMIFQKSKNQIGWQKALKILFTSYWVEQHVVVQRVKQFTFFTHDTLVLVRHAGQLVGWKDARWNKIILIHVLNLKEEIL